MDNVAVAENEIKNEIEYQGFWIRLLAYIIDIIVVILLAVSVGIIFTVLSILISIPVSVFIKDITGFFFLIGFVIPLLVSIFVPLGYFSYFDSGGRQTVGKELCHIEVVDNNGEPLTISRSFVRFLLKGITAVGLAILSIIPFLGFAVIGCWIGFSKKHQSVYDEILNTYVVKSRKQKINKKQTDKTILNEKNNKPGNVQTPITNLYENQAGSNRVAIAPSDNNGLFLKQIDDLYDSLNTGDIQKAEQLIDAIGNSKNVLALEPLCILLEYPDEVIRLSSVIALGKIGQKSTIDPLVKASNDQSVRVRENVAIALGRIGDSKAKYALQRLTSDVPQVRNAAIRAIQQIEQRK